MTLLETINAIEIAATQQPSINMVVRNDVFRLNAIPDAKYGVFAWTQGRHIIGEDSQTFVFTFFYVDRLTANKANEVEIQSVGIQTIHNILLTLDEWGIPFENWEVQTFNQRFLDECAGVYATVRLQVPVSWACPDDIKEYPEWPDARRSEYLDVMNIKVVNGTLIVI